MSEWEGEDNGNRQSEASERGIDVEEKDGVR